MTLAQRILAINLAGLLLFVAGTLVLDETRERLIEFRIRDLENQGWIIARAVASTADPTVPFPHYDPRRANQILQRLDLPTPIRIRIYDRRGRLTGDTRNLRGPHAAIRRSGLVPDWTDPRTALYRLADLIDWMQQATGVPPPIYIEVPTDGTVREEEVRIALTGRSASAVRANSAGETIVSVAVPVQRLKSGIGALVVSTEGGDIDGIVREERVQLLQIALVALAVSVVLSFWLGRLIARPMHELAENARTVARRSRRLPLDPARQIFVHHTGRRDEIGALARALRRMTDALYSRIHATETFAADVAHELKNPLTSLRSAVETVRHAGTDDGIRERLLAVIESDVLRLDRLVTEISNASRIDAEMAREEIARFDLREPVRTVAELTEERAHETGIRIRLEMPDGPVTTTGIESRVAQVIDNLLSNAISFSPPGGTVWLRLQSGRTARLAVEDEGPGIPEDQLEKIFDRFHTDRPQSEAFGRHSGLGLSIARQIVESFEGRIWAENRSGGGACFVIELPA